MRAPGEIVSAIPYLLGFQPRESLVVISLREKRIGMIARLDLADAREQDAIASVSAALARDGASGVIMVAFGDDRLTTAFVLFRWQDELTDRGFPICEQLSVVDGLWFNEICSEERCCPSVGTPVADCTAAPTIMTLHDATGGFLDNREVLVKECLAEPTLTLAAVRSELATYERRDDEGDVPIAHDLAAVLGWADHQPTPRELASAAYAMGFPPFRDVLYAVTAPDMLTEAGVELKADYEALRALGVAAGALDAESGRAIDADARDRILSALRVWARSVPDDLPEITRHTLSVVATAHWFAGDGARARALLERTLALGVPPPSMVGLLLSALDHGVTPPSVARARAAREG